MPNGPPPIPRKFIAFAPEFFHLVAMARYCGFLILLCGWLGTALAFPVPIQLDVDATAAPRNLLHARLRIPVTPGPLTLYYPKWIPGEHMPSGPLNDLTGLQITAQSQPLEWQRDPVDMFAFHLNVPAGVQAVQVEFDFLLAAGGGAFSSGGSSSSHLLDLNWNQLLLYPATTNAALQTPFAATLKLPAGWQCGTALPLDHTSGDRLVFAVEPLETLIDSPVIAGEYFRTVELTPGEKTPHFIHLVADDTANLIAPDAEYFSQLTKLVHEAGALFGAHHYRDYHFLLTVSDHVAHFGLEHHESSDDRVGANYLTDDNTRAFNAELLPHEMFHSWNGKYRRPAGLATPDYQQPMRDELLWIYEGLTSYYGKVLATRAGLQSPEDYYQSLALLAAMLDHRNGRQWRSLADTTVAAQILLTAPGAGMSRRRGIDFYPEGDLIWLEADTLVRQQTGGKKSLDDFCRAFFGGKNSAPQVVPYGYDDVVRALNAIAPGDWKAFFQQRVYAITPHAPLGGIINGGWRLAWTNEVPDRAENPRKPAQIHRPQLLARPLGRNRWRNRRRATRLARRPRGYFPRHETRGRGQTRLVGGAPAPVRGRRRHQSRTGATVDRQ